MKIRGVLEAGGLSGRQRHAGMPCASRASSPNDSDGLLPLRAMARPSSTSMSLSGRPSVRAASATICLRTLSPAICAEQPALTAWRLANAPTPCEIAAVSPIVITMSSMRQPTLSATICDSVVRVPWPWLVAPVATATLPFGSTRTVTPSNGPRPVPST